MQENLTRPKSSDFNPDETTVSEPTPEENLLLEIELLMWKQKGAE